MGYTIICVFNLPVHISSYISLFVLQVFALSPGHPAWKRERPPQHGGAHRIHPDTEMAIKLSQSASQICKQCGSAGALGSSQWCSSSTAGHSSTPFFPNQSKCRVNRPSISAPLCKRRKVKLDRETRA